MAKEPTFTDAHQHGVSKLPLRAGAQSFGLPQTGHSKFGLGVTSQCGSRGCCLTLEANRRPQWTR